MSKRLGEWWRRLTHRHQYRQRQNWAILNGDLVCLRTTQCDECGHKSEEALLLIATEAQLDEARSKPIQMGK